ncbi:MAG: mechanosensitive ion channel domain-containing protein [Candidatus Acidiferrum sp.]
MRAVVRKSLTDDIGSFFAACMLLLALALFCLGVNAQTQAATGSGIPSDSSVRSANPAQGAEAPASNPATPQTVRRPIPLAQIADRAEKLDQLLHDIRNQLAPEADLLESERKTGEAAEEIRRRVLEGGDLLANNATPMELEDERRYWRVRNQEYSAQRKLLTERASRLEELLRLIDYEQAEWLATWDQIYKMPGIETVINRVRQELDGIETTRAQTLEQLNLVLTLQNQVSQQDQIISGAVFGIRQAREGGRSRLLQRDSRPLWESGEPHEGELGVGSYFRRSLNHSFATAREFLGVNKLSIAVLLVCYLLVLAGISELRMRSARGTPPAASGESEALLARPFSVALLVVLLGGTELATSAPIGIAFIFYLLYIIPVLRLLVPLIQPQLRTFLYVLATFYALVGANLVLRIPPAWRREVHALLMLSALISFGWLSRPSRVREIEMSRSSLRIFTNGIRVCLALLAISLIANITGFVSLSQVLGLIALLGPFTASGLYCGVRVLKWILSRVLQTLWARTLLEMRVPMFERWGGQLLVTAAAFLWLRLMLRLFTAYESVKGAVMSAFEHPIGAGKLHFTLGDAFGFLLILVGGYALANGITFLVKKVVLPRLPLKRGVPYAISTVTYYCLLMLVVLAGLSAAGVDMSKFTVLTGALGVGLGFGLQNIVSNFVSGLILLFERPIHVGDTVEVGGLVGIVRRIGARSSTVVTYQGAEVIVPNSNLLSNQVINWTLSSQLRRVDVQLSVAYGTDPERVIKLLVGIAESHPNVMVERPPAAFFMGFGESALNFELRFWCDRQDTWFQLQSDVTVAIAKGLQEAGIEIPFPQRDLHLRSVSASATEVLAPETARGASSADLATRNAGR